jgi:hypothetical protein
VNSSSLSFIRFLSGAQAKASLSISSNPILILKKPCSPQPKPHELAQIQYSVPET